MFSINEGTAATSDDAEFSARLDPESPLQLRLVIRLDKLRRRKLKQRPRLRCEATGTTALHKLSSHGGCPEIGNDGLHRVPPAAGPLLPGTRARLHCSPSLTQAAHAPRHPSAHLHPRAPLRKLARSVPDDHDISEHKDVHIGP